MKLSEHSKNHLTFGIPICIAAMIIVGILSVSLKPEIAEMLLLDDPNSFCKLATGMIFCHLWSAWMEWYQ